MMVDLLSVIVASGILLVMIVVAARATRRVRAEEKQFLAMLDRHFDQKQPRP